MCRLQVVGCILPLELYTGCTVSVIDYQLIRVTTWQKFNVERYAT